VNLKYTKLSIFFFACLLTLCVLGGDAWAARGRPHIDSSMGFNRLLSDQDTLLRGVSLSWDGGDPYGSQPQTLPTQESLNALATKYGFNALHLYLEGDSSGNTDPVGYNAADCDILVERCAKAGLYLIITIGCNGENGAIYSMQFILDFWNFYGPRYKDETHVLYEAKNEPVFHTAAHWKPEDWDKQVLMYNTIRTAAPDTMILLFSFMGFRYEGEASDGVKYVEARGVDWSNAAVAWHGYETREGIEKCLSLFKTSLSYPATICTEFWPGDTIPDAAIEGDESYNAAFESHQTGWTQFQWLAGNDDELPGLAYRLEKAGIVWTPDMPTATWPVNASPNIPAHGSAVGIFDRGRGKFVSARGDLSANLDTYTGDQDDKFILEHTGPGLVSFKAPNGLYVSTACETDALTAVSADAGLQAQFQWFELPNGDVALRAYGGGGHLINSRILTIQDKERLVVLPDANNAGELATHYAFVDGDAPSEALSAAPVVVEQEPEPGPYSGTPHAIPGVIEAIDFDHGGEGVAYHDVEAENFGGFYRPKEGVDIQSSSEGGCGVSWIEDGEWLQYTVDVAEAGTYTLVTHYAGGNSSFHVEFDGADKTGPVKTTESGGWQVWSDVSTTVNLAAGRQTMRFVCKSGYNLRRFTFVATP
jgi:hypothetical protein